ncbi:MAG: alkaline phosphatase D family protein [Actinomycetales bacterium]
MTEATLLLGPLLRYVDSGAATIWVEVDRPARVTVTVTDGARPGPRGPEADVPEAHTAAGDDPTAGAPEAEQHAGHADTWTVHGHHYALVILTGLPAQTTMPYRVLLSARGESGGDARQVWPPTEPGNRFARLPASVIRTFGTQEEFRLAFGSCRRSAGDSRQDLRRFGADALVALARRMQRSPVQDWPHALFCGGDQVYADLPSPEQKQRLLAARGITKASQLSRADPMREVAEEIQSFEEYTWLYHDSWARPDVRWLLSTVPTVMLLDDHDLRDDWNTSEQWRRTVTAKPWWRPRVLGAYVSYWVYQHLGNLSPAQLEQNEIYALVREIEDDAEPDRRLDQLAWEADTDPAKVHWSFVRDFERGDVRIRLVAVDSRSSRVLEPDHRAMLDPTEMEWLAEMLNEPVDHLLVGATLPLLMVPGIHHLEGWNEALAAGRFGRTVARASEWLRQVVDLEHWAAFRDTFTALVRMLDEVVTRSDPPASVLILSGDVHCSYVATAQLPGQDERRTGVHQLTMSPFRNPLEQPIRVANRLLSLQLVRRMLRRLADGAGVDRVPVEWEVTQGLWFDNGVMTVVIRGRQARVDVDHAHVEGTEQVLRRTTSVSLTPRDDEVAER